VSRRDALRAGGVLGAGLVAGVGRFDWVGASAPADRATRARRAVATTLEELREAMPRTARGVERALAAGRPGQLYLSLEGEALADLAWGVTPDGDEMAQGTLVSWASAVKPCTATCVMKLWEAGDLDLDDRVTRFMPQFGAHDKGDVTVRHLLTHTAHLGGYLGPQEMDASFEEHIAAIVSAPREPYAAWGAGAELPRPGLRSGYNPAGLWILAEICRRLYGRDFQDIIRSEVFLPCGMSDSWCGMPVERYRAYRAEGRYGTEYLADEDHVWKAQPAGGGVGPSRELARFYEMMLGRGTIDGRPVLRPQTVEAMTTPKSGLGYMGIWGLGFNVNLPDGVEPPPAANARAEARLERYGPYASPRTFGHPGASGMVAFADPVHGLAAAFIGRAPIDAAIYEDLGLA
jgi:CubicO group peptidase (beta-lactamase class C family)